MTSRAWFIGVAAIVLALLLHAVWPRYEWRPTTDDPRVVVRVDRWTGRATVYVMHPDTGQMLTVEEARRVRAGATR